jgi:hypothetical protein
MPQSSIEEASDARSQAMRVSAVALQGGRARADVARPRLEGEASDEGQFRFGGERE